MQRARWLLVLPFALLPACIGPTGEDIDDAIEQELRSVAGAWSGQTAGANAIVLEFQLTESGAQVQGSGTMREQGGSAVPITVAGTFNRPALSLTFSGMQYEGRTVTGQFQATYNNIVLSAPLELTATGYSRSLTAILAED